MPRFPAAGCLHERDLWIVLVKSTEHVHAVRLMLDSHHLCSEATERTNAIAHMRADVEGEVTRTDESRVERIHRRVTRRVSVIDLEGAPQRANPGVALQDGQLVLNSAGHAHLLCTASISGGGSKSSGMPHKPIL